MTTTTTTTNTTMIAAVYHEFGGHIQLERVPRPSCPNDGVLIRVMATGVCRSDWHGWKGHDSDIRQHGLPFVPGHEVSGIVVEIGQVERFQIGDRVAVPFILSCGTCAYCSCAKPTVCEFQKQPGFTQYGSFAEYLAVPRAERNLAIIPHNVTFEQAAALGCRFTTAYRAVLQQGQLRSDGSIAVFGCGGLGLSCIMFAVAKGCRTIVAIDVSEPVLLKARSLGATHTVLTSNKDPGALRSKIQEITNSDGADVCIEASGFAAACENAIACVRRGGRVVQVGLVSNETPLRVPMDVVVAREIVLVGSHGFAAKDLPDLLQMVAKKQLDPAALIERHVTLEEGARAIQAMDLGSPLGITLVTKFPHDNTASKL